MLTEMAGELRKALEQVPEPSTKEEKTALKKKRKQLKELEEHRDKLQEYDNRLNTLQKDCRKGIMVSVSVGFGKSAKSVMNWFSVPI